MPGSRSLSTFTAEGGIASDKIYELERDLEKDACAFAVRQGWYSRKYKTQGRRAAPDRLFIKNGHFLFVEFKRLGREPTEQQWKEIKALQEAGADVLWIDSIEDFKAVLMSRECRRPGKKEAASTPKLFRDTLLALARQSNVNSGTINK